MIRPARAADRQRILEVVEAAFGSHEEADLVRRIWASQGYRPSLELVAEADGEIVGHALFSIGRLGDAAPVPALAPLAVLPDHQRLGVGSGLVTNGLERCDQDGWPVVVVTGHPDYYPRFGFEPATPLGIHPANAEAFADLRAFMARRLNSYGGQTGVYRYCWEVNDVGDDSAD